MGRLRGELKGLIKNEIIEGKIEWET